MNTVSARFGENIDGGNLFILNFRFWVMNLPPRLDAPFSTDKPFFKASILSQTLLFSTETNPESKI
jgi:hypothetical protein